MCQGNPPVSHLIFVTIFSAACLKTSSTMVTPKLAKEGDSTLNPHSVAEATTAAAAKENHKGITGPQERVRSAALCQ